jgi:hypothetical protein
VYLKYNPGPVDSRKNEGEERHDEKRGGFDGRRNDEGHPGIYFDVKTWCDMLK